MVTEFSRKRENVTATCNAATAGIFFFSLFVFFLALVQSSICLKRRDYIFRHFIVENMEDKGFDAESLKRKIYSRGRGIFFRTYFSIVKLL